MAKSKSSPARGRYEERNPVFSTRLPRALYERLDAAAAARGVTRAELLAVLLDERPDPGVQLPAARTEWPGFEHGYGCGAWDVMLWVCSRLQDGDLDEALEPFVEALANWEKDEELEEFSRLVQDLVLSLRQRKRPDP